ncbi:BglG family transcription antiterminator [Pectinatus haikarae]|uniref:BglG family transcription antiterminator n=1 Tax=Pectinatus haikarae TaxID=349096 RepID=UPI0018C72280|nr:PTS sugar transporter subunit IIA [Pectinatus haikarae]
MKSKEREEFIIYYLLQQSSFVTVANLAKEIFLSSKTVYRLIKQINQQSNTNLIDAEKGKGIRLNYEAYLESHYNHNLNTDKKKSIHYNFSPVERRLHIMKELLFHAPLSLKESELFSRYYLSPSAIYTDEDTINQGLIKYGLTLQKNNNRLSIAGPEHHIRKALIQLLTKLNLINFNDLKNVSVEFDKSDLRFIIRQIELIEKEIDSIIPAPYNVNLLSHLYILICRARKGDFDQSKSDAGIDLSQDIYYTLAQKVKENIEGYICKKLPRSETTNICNYLAGSRMESEISGNLNTPVQTEVQQITNFYVQEFSRRSGIPVHHEFITAELASHISPMLNRMRSGLTVKNPLFDDIRQEYGSVYQTIRQISDYLPNKFRLPAVDNDEASFITLYFARYIEQHPHQVRALLICTTGMGTSELLRIKVKRFFPEIYVVGTAPTRSITPEYLTEQDVDLILTTVKLSTEWPVPAILVNTLFIERDKQNVRQALDILRQKPKTGNSAIEKIPIIEFTSVAADKSGLFRQLLKYAPSKITEYETDILAGLKEREQLGDTCIAPGIALAHAQLPHLPKAFFAISLLPEPFRWDADGNNIRILFMIILPDLPTAENITFLHQLMKKLANDDIVERMQNISSKKQLRQLLFADQ